MKHKHFTLSPWCLVTLSLILLSSPALAQRSTQSFDNDWRFFKGEPVPAQGAAGNYAPTQPPSPAFDDSAWRKLDLPHDWSIEGPFDQNNPTAAAGAYAPSGVAWYRKTFTLPTDARGKRVSIEFDGVMANSDVYLNNSLLGHRPNGYVPFRYDLTDLLNNSGPNVLAVRTDTARQPASRWYTGAGIYRHTRLLIQNSVHIEHGATFISTPDVKGEQAIVRVKTTVANQSGSRRDISVAIVLSDGDRILSTLRLPAKQVVSGNTTDFEQDIPVDRPHFWDITDPHLYSAALTVRDGAESIDSETIRFGIRLVEFKPDTGFWLNGQNIKIKGVCLHHDAGALGASVPVSAWESRLSALKAIGVNAIRTAHNPPSTEFLDACDRLGLLVMDEAFDAWTIGKEPADYHLYFKDWWQRDLEAMIKRDRNHPSILIWSLGNEIWDILPQNPDPAADQFTGPNRSIDVARNLFLPMRDLAHQLDPSRPVTIAMMRPNVAGIYTNGFADLEDVIGQNYRDAELVAAHQQNPARKIIGTENTRTRDVWLLLRDNPSLSGQFLWAGVDYLGEAGRWPTVFAGAGLLDHTNFPKADALERDAWWNTKPVVHLARTLAPAGRGGAGTTSAPGGRGAAGRGGRGPAAVANWSPANADPHTETINVYSNCDDVELFLNDKSFGAKPKNADDAPRQWQVPFAPGTLRAVGKNAGQVVARDELKTAGPPAKIVLLAERTSLPHDWDDVRYIRAYIADAAGNTIPTASDLITFAVDGPGRITAVDSGSATDHDPFQSNQRHAYQGSCIAILHATADTGTITLTASANGVADGSTRIAAAPPRTR